MNETLGIFQGPPWLGADRLEIFWNAKPLDWLKTTLNFRTLEQFAIEKKNGENIFILNTTIKVKVFHDPLTNSLTFTDQVERLFVVLHPKLSEFTVIEMELRKWWRMFYRLTQRLRRLLQCILLLMGRVDVNIDNFVIVQDLIVCPERQIRIVCISFQIDIRRLRMRICVHLKREK